MYFTVIFSVFFFPLSFFLSSVQYCLADIVKCFRQKKMYLSSVIFEYQLGMCGNFGNTSFWYIETRGDYFNDEITM